MERATKRDLDDAKAALSKLEADDLMVQAQAPAGASSSHYRWAPSRHGTDEGEAYVLRLNRHYDAAVEDVWDACTDPRRIGRWFLPVGGEIKSCEPPRRLAVTWELYGGVATSS